MWSSLFPPAADPDPKLISLELKNPKKLGALVSILSQLYQQEKKLIAEIKDEAGDPFYIKAKEFESIMSKIRAAIAEFNQHESDDCNPALILVFVTKLKKIIQNGLDKNRDELNRQRNDNKASIQRGIRRATTAGSLAAGYLTFSPIVLLGGFAVSDRVSDAIQHALSLDDENIVRSQSVILFENAVDLLANIQLAMEYDLKRDQKEDEDSFLECPISKAPFKDPVLCTLDGRIYEKSAILEALRMYGKSPMNNRELGPDEEPESVLVSCYTIREAIEELEAKYKKLEAVTPPVPPEFKVAAP